MTDRPTAVRTDSIEICGHTLRVYQLDDGRRVIDADDFNALFSEMRRGDAKPSASDLDRMRRFMRGDLQ